MQKKHTNPDTQKIMKKTQNKSLFKFNWPLNDVFIRRNSLLFD